MTTGMSAEQLARQIERLVEDFVSGGRAAATAAVERAFSTGRQNRRRPSQEGRREIGPRRSSTEMEALAEKLYRAICEQPGEAMIVLAAKVGSTPRALQVPAKHLRAAGRIRSAGQRQFARYFPMAKNSSRSS